MTTVKCSKGHDANATEQPGGYLSVYCAACRHEWITAAGPIRPANQETLWACVPRPWWPRRAAARLSLVTFMVLGALGAAMSRDSQPLRAMSYANVSVRLLGGLVAVVAGAVMAYGIALAVRFALIRFADYRTRSRDPSLAKTARWDVTDVYRPPSKSIPSRPPQATSAARESEMLPTMDWLKNLNWRRGLTRVYVALSVVWVLFLLTQLSPKLTLGQVLVSLVLVGGVFPAVLFFFLRWVINGFVPAQTGQDRNRVP